MNRTRTYLRPFLAIFCALCVYILVNFQNYNKPYQTSYIMDLYGHSQWNVKFATRSIGDDYLYQAAAYHILTTGKIAEINSEVPPLGKYLFSFSLITFGTPYYALPFIYILCALLFFSLALRLYDRKGAWLVLVLFLMEPLLGLQAGGTLLDLPQLCWLLLHVWFMLRYISAESRFRSSGSLMMAGLFLGFFIGTKFGVLVVAIILADIYLLLLHRKIFSLVPLLFSMAITYMLLFIPYMLEKGSFTAWIDLERSRLSFYRHSFTPYIPGTGLLSLVVPWFFTWWGNKPALIREWNTLWPIGLGTLICLWWTQGKQVISALQTLIAAQKQNKNTPSWQTVPTVYTPPANAASLYLLILTTLLLILSVLIPFWPRYLTLVLPFIYLLSLPILTAITSRFTKPVRYGLVAFLCAVHMIRFAFVITPSAADSVATYQQWFTNSLYQDIYQSLSDKKNVPDTRESFFKQALAAENAMQLRGKKVQLTTASMTYPWETTRKLQLITTYQTPLGDYQVSAPLTLVREFNQWRLSWSWDYFAPDFKPTDKLLLTLVGSPGTELEFAL